MSSFFKTLFNTPIELFMDFNLNSLDIFSEILDELNQIEKLESFKKYKETLVKLKDQYNEEKNKAEIEAQIIKEIKLMDDLLYKIENYLYNIGAQGNKKDWVNKTIKWVYVIIDWRKVIKPFMPKKFYYDYLLHRYIEHIEIFLKILEKIPEKIHNNTIFDVNTKNNLIQSLKNCKKEIESIQTLKESKNIKETLEYEREIWKLPNTLEKATLDINEVEKYLYNMHTGFAYKEQIKYFQQIKRINKKVKKNSSIGQRGLLPVYTGEGSEGIGPFFLVILAGLIVRGVFKGIYEVTKFTSKTINSTYQLYINGVKKIDLTGGIVSIKVITNETEYFRVIMEYMKNRVKWDNNTKSVFKQDTRGLIMSQFYRISSKVKNNAPIDVTSTVKNNAPIDVTSNGKKSNGGSTKKKKKKKTNTLKYS